MPDIHIEAECSECGTILSAYFDDDCNHIMVDPCKKCAEKIVEEDRERISKRRNAFRQLRTHTEP